MTTNESNGSVNDDEAEEGEVVHGIRDGYYSNLPGPEMSAILECLCGYEATMWSRRWEDAGAVMDEHIGASR